ncbi:MAG: hypothetical protein EXS31_08560 [Pedosphaera sp.]|nr:hypothetical protein [Pedosphaera sp.]
MQIRHRLFHRLHPLDEFPPAVRALLQFEVGGCVNSVPLTPRLKVLCPYAVQVFACPDEDLFPLIIPVRHLNKVFEIVQSVLRIAYCVLRIGEHLPAFAFLHQAFGANDLQAVRFFVLSSLVASSIALISTAVQPGEFINLNFEMGSTNSSVLVVRTQRDIPFLELTFGTGSARDLLPGWKGYIDQVETEFLAVGNGFDASADAATASPREFSPPFIALLPHGNFFRLSQADMPEKGFQGKYALVMDNFGWSRFRSA